jgi:elongation factor P
MLSYNDITTGKVVIYNGEPYKVLSHHVFRMQMRKPVNQTKMKSLKTGKVVEYSFHQNENAEEAQLETLTIVFIYESKGEFWFNEKSNPSKRFALNPDLIGPGIRFLKQKNEYEALTFEDEIIGINIPVKMQLLVTEAVPAVKGNTAQNATKTVVVETGATIVTPLFVNQGDVIEVNTESGDYVGRVEKA